MYWSQNLEDSDSSHMKILVLIEFLAAQSFWTTAVSEQIGTGVGNLQLGRQSSSQLITQPHPLLPPKPILCSSCNALLAVPNPRTYFHISKHLLLSRERPSSLPHFPCVTKVPFQYLDDTSLVTVLQSTDVEWMAPILGFHCNLFILFTPHCGW